MDHSVARLIRARARAEGTSVNRLVKRLLEESLGVRPAPSKNRAAFGKLCGAWTKAQAAEFERAVADFDKVDPSDWR